MQPENDPPTPIMDNITLPQDMLVVVVIRQYFGMLRAEKGHKPDASPLELELLLIVKFIVASDGNPVELLRNIGIILVGDKIVINCGLLKDTLLSSRSRINNTLNKLKWDIIPMGNNDKWTLLKPLLDRSDVRNWSIRQIPAQTQLYRYIQENPQVLFSDGQPGFNNEQIALAIDSINNITIPTDGTQPGGLAEAHVMQEVIQKDND
ncbi:hypothetical protein TRFO_06353 [Tritrichomonas foetus]|uniref:Initiator binding domain-containing protein n=1 Tax=Tritrichomonas foetus TaxID=1144522 RepID=A0A1J4JZ63_9EUKA|nr:hypothetical protein TRFO_06353 [Tritrichomonas foetus]|eukprot:OHT04449.1 hypothetical protein TRFO_06353 [Tritrichomonas foetus]